MKLRTGLMIAAGLAAAGLLGAAAWKYWERAWHIPISSAPTPEIQSWYVPGAGTVNIHSVVPRQPPRLVSNGGLSHGDIIILSWQGHNIARVAADGRLRWQLNFSRKNRPKDLNTHEGYFTIVQSGHVSLRNLADGREFATIEPDIGAGKLRSYRRLADDRELLIYESGDDRQIVEVRASGNGVFQYAGAREPRAAALRNNTLVVADTFLHRISVLDIESGKSLGQFPAYFPNDVSWVEDEILVTEEHANRVYLLDWRSGHRKWVFGCKRQEFGDLDSDIAALTPKRARAWTRQDSKSICAANSPLEATLYSPNCAIRNPDGSYLVCDTDNHRVVHVTQAGTVLRVIDGLNNPVKTALVNE